MSFRDSTIKHYFTLLDEINIYLNKTCGNEDIMAFWKNVIDLPRLKAVARHILSIPASSATSERVFSVSGRILEERRTQLISENVDKLLFLNKNM